MSLRLEILNQQNAIVNESKSKRKMKVNENVSVFKWLDKRKKLNPEISIVSYVEHNENTDIKSFSNFANLCQLKLAVFDAWCIPISYL